MKRVAFLIIALLTGVGAFSQSGPTWVGSNFGYNYIFRGIDFPSGQNEIGFAAGESLTYNGNGIVVKTTDGGATWTQVWTGTGEGVEGACFVDTQTGFIAGWPRLGQGWSGFARTTDGGTTWTSYPVTNDIYFFTDVVFKDANNGILIGQTNLGMGAWWTSNGGTTWTAASGLASIPYHACHVSGNTYYLSDNNGNIQRSTDNGHTWNTVFSQTGVILAGIDFYNDNIGMACGDYGVIVKTYDGGNSWEIEQVGNDIWHDIAWETENNVFVCGTPGLIIESTDGGATWQASSSQGVGQQALYECIFTADGHGFICGSQGIEVKRDPSCGAGFSAASSSPCTGDSVAFTSESWGNVSTWNWEFQGGSPATSSDPNPVVQYNSTGTFDVKLTVSNPWWSNSLVKTDYITVTQEPATPVISLNGYVLSSNIPTGNQWFLDGDMIPGATGQTYEAIASGIYWDVVTNGNCTSDTSNHIQVVMAGTEEAQASGLVVSPLPNNGRFTVYLPGSPTVRYNVEVFNLFGSKIYQKQSAETAGGAVLHVCLGNVPAGAYFLVVTGPGCRWSRTLVVI